MKLTFDISNLSIDEQKALYLWLKTKFDPHSASVCTETSSLKEEILNKSLKDLGLSSRVYNRLMSRRIYTIRDLCNQKRSELIEITNFGDRSCVEVEAVLAKFGLTLKVEL